MLWYYISVLYNASCAACIYSFSKVWGGQQIYWDNITQILDGLLDNYDNRLRPGFGGNI